MSITETSEKRIKLAAGRQFIGVDAGEVVAFLKARRKATENTHTKHLHIIADSDGSLILEVTGGSVRQYPVRVSFFEKLCMWHRFPAEQMRKMPLDTVVATLNGILGLIGHNVNVTSEDGEALTVTSNAYTELPDLAVLEQCSVQLGGISNVTRTDTLLSIAMDNRIETKPVVGDACGIGLRVTNSETGFSALRVATAILRYVCTNGAVVPVSFSGGEGLTHYGISRQAMEKYLETESGRAVNLFPKVTEWLARSAQTPVSKSDIAGVSSRLSNMMGYREGRTLMEPYSRVGLRRTQYDLFNTITHEAKSHEPRTRLRMEELAGRLLQGAV